MLQMMHKNVENNGYTSQTTMNPNIYVWIILQQVSNHQQLYIHNKHSTAYWYKNSIEFFSHQKEH
jgi:hypothetical protein